MPIRRKSHQACFECRRQEAYAWQHAWRAGNRADHRPRAGEMDNVPHAERGDLEAGLARVLEDLAGGRGKRVALVLPDTTAKVSLIRFEKIPARVQDLDQLIRWQVRKTAPFRIEDAQLSWQPGAGLEGGGREFIVSMARRDVVQSFERVCAAAGVT